MFSLQAEEYLKTIRIPLHLSCITKSGWPIGLSLWYIYINGNLYCATQESAKVIGYLIQNPRCSFEVASDQPPYCGVRGQALSRIDKTIGSDILKQLIVRYLGSYDNPLAQKLLKKANSEVAIVISPTNYFTWDYTERMQISIQNEYQHPCP